MYVLKILSILKKKKKNLKQYLNNPKMHQQPLLAQ